MGLLTTKQIKEAVRQLTLDLGRSPTYQDLTDFFGLRSPQHARYYISKAEQSGAVRIDRQRQPHWLRVAE